MHCEIILPSGMRKRQRTMLDAMVGAASRAGVQAAPVAAYTGCAPVVMTWGLGHPGRRAALLQHVRQGGHVVGWDLGYWHRDDHYRLTMDNDHPRELLRDMPGGRFDAAGIALRQDYAADGPIILVGLGEKSRKVLGHEGQQWEERMYYALRTAYPRTRILYRPKRPETFGLCEVVQGEIADVLRGASLVACNHSNVAIDACIAGIPVVCNDGAAAALYGNDVTNPLHATHAQRLAFLRRLAWWQWSPNEAMQAWAFVKQITCG